MNKIISAVYESYRIASHTHTYIHTYLHTADGATVAQRVDIDESAEWRVDGRRRRRRPRRR